ncbi:NADP-dependent oxidoreductase [Aquipuribacter sp. MA13-6]|uniref:NADP-dependent oxidoreductase n=1 Tax=unclassified Aquipuribacter TaxID=2635084 RepID=UPI003EF0891C
MRAVFYSEYGDSHVLQVGDLPDPVTGPDDLVVRVAAAGVNPVDWKIRAGYLDGAFPSGFPIVPGWDVAGTVEAVGPAVTSYAVGDRVLGYARKDHVQHGTTAELVRVAERHLAPLPDGVDLTVAAAIPLVGLTALQAVEAAGVGADDTVLVHAAAGGVGAFAVQLARLRGARVVGTASEGNHEYLRSIGAEPVTYGDGLADRVRALLDGSPVTAALDFVGGDEAVAVSFELVADPARVVTVTDGAPVLERGGRYVFVRPDSAQLATLAGLVADGSVQVEVSRTFGLDEVAAAHDLSAQGHGRGKVVVTIA